MKNKQLEEKLNNLPQLPGCYIWKNSDEKILYVGKAVNLKNRVNSYFNNYVRLDPKIKMMVDQINDVDIYTVDSEVEALILETNLIKKYRPKYNKLMKDDKNYSFLEINWYKAYPTIKLTREQQDKKAEYYGPYPNRFPLMQVLRRLRKIFPYCEHLPNHLKIAMPDGRQEKLKIKNEDISERFKPCFDTHIGLCSGVCAGLVTKEEHRKNINGIRKFFQGKKMDMIEDLKKDMVNYSKESKFEKAAMLRDRISDLEYVTQRIKIDKDMDETKLEQMKDELGKRALKQLIEKLDLNLDSQKLNFKIECFDISNIQGTNAVASMVVFVNGKADKSLYRKFKIKTKQTPDDFAMMREVLTRRLKRLKIAMPDGRKENLKIRKLEKEIMDESFSVKPDLIIVDGGKGQLSAAFDIFAKSDLLNKIPLIGLAKREEEIFYIKNYVLEPKEIEFGRTVLPKRSDALYLIQRIRDEAHRFAITFHRKLRGKASTKSALDDVKGVGKVVKKKLLDAFGTVEGIRKASEADLLTVVRNKKTVKNLRNRVK